MLKGQFIADARQQLKAGSPALTASDYSLVMSATSALPGRREILADTPLTLADLQAQGPAKGGAHRFDIYGYSGDILLFRDPQAKTGNTRQVLYIPGSQPAFVGFAGVDALREWVVEQARDPKKCAALAAHFSLHDRQDGATIFGTSGVNSALKGLAKKSHAWSRDAYIDMKASVIKGDVFTQSVGYIRQRQEADANTLIKSNGELDKDLWIADIEAGEAVLVPLSPLAAPVALVSALAGTALVGLGTDKAVSGDTQAERKQGLGVIGQGVLDILFSAGPAPDTPLVDPFEPSALPGEPASSRPENPLGTGTPLHPPKDPTQGVPQEITPIKSDMTGSLSKFRSGFTTETAARYRISAGEQKGMYQIAHELYVPIKVDGENSVALYRIRENKSGVFELVKPGEFSSWGAPWVKQNENGSFSVVRNELKGGGGGSSKIQSFEPGAYDVTVLGEAESLKRLEKDAKKFYSNAKAQVLPVHPEIPPNAPPAEVINTLYKKSAGIIVGEDHSEAAGLRFLIDNVAEFKRNNVTVLYTEGFTHDVQEDLNSFYDTGIFSQALKDNLRLIDRSHARHGHYTNTNLLSVMRENGIRTTAIDVPSVSPIERRLKTMNYYAAKVIEADKTANPEVKWVARVGAAHVFAYDDTPPILGLSELTGATGVELEDAAPNKETSIIQPPRRTQLFIDLKQ